jgi:hypothetical protein
LSITLDVLRRGVLLPLRPVLAKTALELQTGADAVVRRVAVSAKRLH